MRTFDARLALLLLPLLAGCDASQGGSTSLGFTGGAIESLPQRADTSSQLSSGTPITDHTQLRKFFKQECFMPGGSNFCPRGLDLGDGGTASPWKFTSTTLLGLVYHAEMYGGGLRTSCGKGRAVTLDPGSLEPAADGGTPGRFVLDAFASYDCLEQDAPPNPASRAFSTKHDYQATLTTRHKVPSGDPAFPMTDIFQVDVSMDAAKAPTFLAFNNAGVASMAARTVLLVNLRTHRFAVKYQTGPATTPGAVMAIGVGGVDRSTGAANAGYYHARWNEPGGAAMRACVDNGTQLLEVDDSECTRTQVPLDWTSSDAVADYLGMDSAQKTRLAPWLARFATPAALGATEAPDGQAQVDQVFPKSIR